MREHEEILLGGMFRPTEQNCPTREGELIESLDKIYDIPNPRVGMRVYVENTGKEYIIKSLKEKTIGGVTVPDAVVETLEETVSEEVLGDVASELADQFSNIERNIKDNALQYNKIGFNVYVDRVQLYAKNISDNDVRVDDIPAATSKRAGVMSAEDKKKLDAAGNGATKIVWDASSNMNDFKTPGVYDIYGERTVKTDNLPITNDGSGHSIAARLTVVASTLQPANNEICVTQFLMLSNRLGGEGNMYVRTYNQNNGAITGSAWSPWQKQMGMVETLINSNDATVGQEIFQVDKSTQKIGDGLNGMIDNGMYSGIYIDNINYTGTGSQYYLSAPPTFVETFVLVVINDYAASGQAGFPRRITQLKYAIDAITGQSTVKKRVGTGNDAISWSDWTDIGGGGVQEVDITDAVRAEGLPALIDKGSVKEGVIYKCFPEDENINAWLKNLDVNGKIFGKINKHIGGADSKIIVLVKIISEIVVVEIYQRNRVSDYTDSSYLHYHKFIMDISCTTVKVSADMTTL